MEQEFDYVHTERQNNMNQLKVFHDAYTEKYRFKHFTNLQQAVARTSLTNREFEKANYEEGIAKDVKILRTNVIYEANDTQLYEATLYEEHCYVKVDALSSFTRKYQVKNLDVHIKMLLNLKCPEKFIQLIKCYVIQNKIYLFINANTSLQRLSG